EPGRTMSFTKPSVMPCIFARGFVDSGSVRTSPEIVPSRTSCSLTPTTAISGLVNTAEETCPEISGETASPRAWCMAMRPCMAAAHRGPRDPVGVDVPGLLDPDAGTFEAQPRGGGDPAQRHQHVGADDLLPRGEGDDHAVALSTGGGGPGAGAHLHAAAGEGL